jgi:hypothetical protein
VRSVAIVGQHRVEHDINDKGTLLRSRSEDNPFNQMDWETIHNSVTASRQELGIERPPLRGVGIELSLLGVRQSNVGEHHPVDLVPNSVVSSLLSS